VYLFNKGVRSHFAMSSSSIPPNETPRRLGHVSEDYQNSTRWPIRNAPGQVLDGTGLSGCTCNCTCEYGKRTEIRRAQLSQKISKEVNAKWGTLITAFERAHTGLGEPRGDPNKGYGWNAVAMGWTSMSRELGAFVFGMAEPMESRSGIKYNSRIISPAEAIPIASNIGVWKLKLEVGPPAVDGVKPAWSGQVHLTINRLNDFLSKEVRQSAGESLRTPLDL
jgi:hypothetical protein